MRTTLAPFIEKYWRLGLLILIVLLAGSVAFYFLGGYLRWSTYTSSTDPRFSVSYLKGSTILEDYVDPLLPPGSAGKAVAFRLPDYYFTDGYLTQAIFAVESVDMKECTALPFVPGATTTKKMHSNGIPVSLASYEFASEGMHVRKAYAYTGTTPCIAVVYQADASPASKYDPNELRYGAADRPTGIVDASLPHALGIFDYMRNSLRLRE